MRIPLIAGNWKMNNTMAEALSLVDKLKPELAMFNSIETVVCPPFISLSAVKDRLAGSAIRLGAQNVYFQEKGAFTGEISPVMLSGLCHYVIIGHSERRQYFHETDDIVNKKITAALKTGLNPILCVGERLEENESGQTEKVIATQLAGGLNGIEKSPGMVIAYEPVWAIGTGRAATGNQANATIHFIREKLASRYGENFAAAIRILYGGSVTPENTPDIMSQPDIDGGLVGGASLKAEQFVSIVKQTAAIKK